jgi:hypothetical protein
MARHASHGQLVLDCRLTTVAFCLVISATSASFENPEAQVISLQIGHRPLLFHFGRVKEVKLGIDAANQMLWNPSSWHTSPGTGLSIAHSLAGHHAWRRYLKTSCREFCCSSSATTQGAPRGIENTIISSLTYFRPTANGKPDICYP